MVNKEIKELLYKLAPSGFIVSLDLETTGVDNSKDKIIEIGATKYDIAENTKEYFSQLVNPMTQISEFIEDLTGISNSDVESMPIIDEVKKNFEDFYLDHENNQHLIIAHNANFDIGFLNGELNSIKKKLIDKTSVIDTLEVARNKFPGLSNSLDALCKRFNIDLSKRTKHNALLDCELLREAYINLLDAKEPKFDLSFSSKDETKSFIRDKTYNKSVLEISEIELKKHKEFLKSELKKNFY